MKLNKKAPSDYFYFGFRMQASCIWSVFLINNVNDNALCEPSASEG